MRRRGAGPADIKAPEKTFATRQDVSKQRKDYCAQHAPKSKMFAKIEELALYLQRRYLAAAIRQCTHLLRTLAADMDHLRERKIHNLPAGIPHRATVIDFLIIPEIARVE